jgi:hypothetical protein
MPCDRGYALCAANANKVLLGLCGRLPLLVTANQSKFVAFGWNFV